MQNLNWQRTDLIDESDEVVLHQTREQKETLEQSSGVQVEDRNAGRVKLRMCKSTRKAKNKSVKGRAVYYTVCPNPYVGR